MLNAALVATGRRRCHVQAVRDTRNVVATALAAVLLAGMSGCATRDRPNRPRVVVSAEPETRTDIWQGVATDADEDRIARIGLAWQSALADARRRSARDVEAEGPLLEPRSALARPAPTPGSYNCRLIKLGRTTTKTPAIEKFKPFFCYVEVEGDLLTIVKQTGSQRPAGRLWEDNRPDRLIFLGSLALGNEEQPLAYGDDQKRDTAGVIERIGPFEWRLVIPWPQDASKLHVFELTPVAEQPAA
jgi:hypothetical protein